MAGSLRRLVAVSTETTPDAQLLRGRFDSRPHWRAGQSLDALAPGLERCQDWLAAAIREDASGPLVLVGHTPGKSAVASAIADAYNSQTIWSCAFTSEISYGNGHRSAEREGGQRAANAFRDTFASARLLVLDAVGLSTQRGDLELLGALLQLRKLRGQSARTVITTHYRVQAFDAAFGTATAGILLSGATLVDVPAQPFRSMP